ncbi:CCAAT/enhancer-binding protein beta-like isoform X1 [Daphnia pulex]|uniref:CCAAT/enhancer-binding protein beta-like isoform X1 n=1 Tax=Daphnia pulex TaxID=6669 RepID=UPI001EDDB4C3|nr:CCAAT/enhancer-binding protein beta-like isoform X1 [Daphnia pulex]XP_046640501.1 CCAAT/enhancer-binding protein beta-like isoform X1 [Daphnia pulicaria]
MSFFDSEFFDITTSGKLEGHLLDYDHPPMSGEIIPFADHYDYYPETLEVAETSMDLEQAMIDSNIGSVADYLSHSGSYQPQPMVKREIAHLQEDEDSRCLPSTLTDASDYTSAMMPSPYGTAVSSPAGRSTTSSSASTSRRFKSGGKNVSKDSDEYKRRRTLNNIAVKKSREKAKAESRIVAQRVTVLSADKERLERRVEQLSKEIQFLHGLFSKFNDIPDPIKVQVTSAFARLQSHR